MRVRPNPMWFWYGQLHPDVWITAVTGFFDLFRYSTGRFRMCKLLMRIIKLITSMSMSSHNDGDDASRRHRPVVSGLVPGPSRETAGSSGIATREPSAAPGATYSTSHVRNSAPSRSLPEFQVPRDARERVDVKRGGAEHRKIPASHFTEDQISMYAKEEQVAKMRDEFRLPKEEDRYRHDVDAPNHKQDTPRGAHHLSLKENFDVHRPPLAHAEDAELIAPASANFQHAYKRELRLLLHEHRATVEEQKRLANVCASLEQEYEERSKKVNVMRHERQEARMQRKEIEDAYMALKQQYQERDQELSTVRHERHDAVKQKQKAEEDYDALRQRCEAQRNGYNTLYHKYRSSKATLKQRTSELQDIQRFFTTADKFSGSEVVNLLWKLNEEVGQNITFMVKWAVEKFMLETPPTDEMTTQTIERTRMSAALGTRLMQLLGTKKHRNNSIMVEMAFRAYLVYELYWIASQRGIGREEEQSHNVYIDGIYQRIWDAEGQAISGNWGALTRAYTLPDCISDPELGHKLQMTIISSFSEILLAAGCTAAKVAITSGLWSKFAEKIAHFVSLAGRVNRIIGVGVISEDFEVQVVWPEAVFDEKTMEDSYDNGDRVQRREEQKESVLCATELGLMQRMRVGASAGENGKPSELIIIKPKVILASVFNIIDK